MSELDDRLSALARSPVLLVACDYDGTLSPIVDDPAAARPNREAIVALKTLADMPQTSVAVISGRALGDLARLTGLPEDVHLVGSHGSEFDPDFASRLSAEAASLRERLLEELSEIARVGNGFQLEEKPGSVAFHYRNADPGDAERALSELERGPLAWEGVFTRRGKMVVELAVVSTNKGTALDRIRHRVGASAALFIGDDVTDEDAFQTLRGPDVGVKVGEGETAAKHRVDDTRDVSRLLAQLCELRGAWLRGAHAVDIQRHSVLSDQRTAALVTPDARLVWLCAPRIDSNALFAELLGGPTAGHFTVGPAGGQPPIRQRYLGDSLVLETAWPGMTAVDYLDCSGNRAFQRAGRTDLVRVLSGECIARIEFAPRLNFGRTGTRLRVAEGGLALEDTLDPIVLRAVGIEWSLVDEGDHQTATAEVDLTRGPVTLELRYGAGTLAPELITEAERRRQTRRFWSMWASQLQLPSVEPELVRRSAVVLRGLCHGPTGAILAACTTSLPEHIGGVRNWDYRFCWLRDAALAASALVRLNSTAEAMRFLDWVLGVVDGCQCPERLQPLYTVTGAELGPEAEISELSGYSGSRPVRVGNAASGQVQLDVFGPIVDLVSLLVERHAPLSSEHWRLVEAMVTAVERRWREPDHGIWEIRKPRRHHVHSKVMCWMTAARAAAISERFLSRVRDEWRALAEEIRNDVLEHGWKEGVGAFTAAYDGDDLDASALWIGLSGLLAPDDPRFGRTVEAVERGLRDGPAVYRYRADDALPGVEGAFNICTGWLIRSMLMVGRPRDAQELFADYCRLAGPTGLLPEQCDPRSGRGLGNHPQAYSHLALIECAVALHESD